MPNGLFVLSTFALLFGATSGAQAAEITVLSPQTPPSYPDAAHHLSVSGEIGATDAKTLATLLDNLDTPPPDAPVQVVLSLNGVTGTLGAAVPLARMIRDRRLATYLGPHQSCTEGCALAFFAGTQNGTDGGGRILSPGAKLGFAALPDMAQAEGEPVEDLEKTLLVASFSGLLPASLVTGLVSRPPGQPLWVETVDQAGRWNIGLQGETAYHGTGERLQPGDLTSLTTHCSNVVNWINDADFADREERFQLDETFAFQGPEAGCSYHIAERVVAYDIWSDEARSGTVLDWQVLPALTALSELAADITPAAQDLSGPRPPARLVQGSCKEGRQWVAGWGGGPARQPIFFADQRACDGGDTVLRLECEPGDASVKVLVADPAAPRSDTAPDLTLQIDDLPPVVLPADPRPAPGFTATVDRNATLIEDLMAGRILRLSGRGATRTLHLSGTRKTLGALLQSCR